MGTTNVSYRNSGVGLTEAHVIYNTWPRRFLPGWPSTSTLNTLLSLSLHRTFIAATMSNQAYYELYRGSRYWIIVFKPGSLCILTSVSSWSSIGLSLTDTLDDLINEGRIEPQLAMKILSTFDRAITEVLADKVRARLNFKVCFGSLSVLLALGHPADVIFPSFRTQLVRKEADLSDFSN